MTWPSLATYDRIGETSEETREGFEKSYLGMRLVIGVLGVSLPVLLVLVDRSLLGWQVSVRGSMSAYYHSPARDIFVGGLSACGVFLASYMFWRWWTWDFLISLAAGLGVLGVATFPTARPRSGPVSTYSCSDQGVTPPCTSLEQVLGEGNVRTLHLVFTFVVVLSFAALCLVFALRDFGYGLGARRVNGHDPGNLGPVAVWRSVWRGRDLGAVVAHLWHKAPRTVLYVVCLVGVLAGAVWGWTGPSLVVPHTYAGEFFAFSWFGTAWLVASWDLLSRARWVDSTFRGVGRRMRLGSG